MAGAPTLVVRPVTPGRWDDLVTLFGPSGAYSGCWCMFHRQTSAEYAAKAGARNRAGVWSITCFFIDRDHRGKGIASALVGSAVGFAAKNGATAIEGYPFDPEHKQTWNSAEAYIGTRAMFAAAGFEEVERRTPGRPLMRYTLP